MDYSAIRYHSHSMSEAAHLAFWFDGRDEWSADYHAKSVQEQWLRLKALMEPTPLEVEGVAANMALVVEQAGASGILGAANPEHVGLSEFHLHDA